MLPFEKLTEHAYRSLNLARGEAHRLHHDDLNTEHLLLGLLQDGNGRAAKLLRRRAIDFDQLRSEIEKLARPGPSPASGSPLPFTSGLKKALEFSMGEAANLGHRHIGTEHLLLGLIHENKGIAWRVLSNLGVKLEDVREDVRENDPAKTSDGEETQSASDHPVRTARTGPSKTPTLDTFGCDLTALARDGELEPLVGREAELDRLIQVLTRRFYPNAVVLGGTGTGKTTLLYGLARAIAIGLVSANLCNKRLLALNLPQIMAETKSGSSFEDRWNAIAVETRGAGDIVRPGHRTPKPTRSLARGRQ